MELLKRLEAEGRPATDAEERVLVRYVGWGGLPQVAATLVEMVQARIPAKFGLDAIRDIQVLCPMNRGSLGIRELNVRLQAELNPASADEPIMEKFGWQFRVRDKVIQTDEQLRQAAGLRAHPSGHRQGNWPLDTASAKSQRAAFQ